MQLGQYKDVSNNVVTADAQFIPQGSSTKYITYTDSGGTRSTKTQADFLATYTTLFPGGLNESI
jgi:hypothetical protein